MQVLTREEWTARKAAHEARVDAWVQPHLARRARGEKHPVEDFLFGYYTHRPAALRRWHPGYGITLKDCSVVEEGEARLETTLANRLPLIRQLRTLLTATASRPAAFGCFGMHEWAMVYQLSQDEVRHAAWPLRLGAAGTDEVVESHGVMCSHFDAFRFFTAPARPLNLLQPGRDDRSSFEQPGCLHANMDLYKAAFRLSPLIASELVADCFELARDIRELDMRASPYDLTRLGYEPIRIETTEGKAEYVAAQRGFSERAAPLRSELIAECERLLA